MQSKAIIDIVSNDASRQFIGQHLKSDVNKLALERDKYPGIDVRTAAGLIALYEKARIKLPEHYKAMAALSPKSYEQSTSEAVAKFKAGIMGIVGKKVINLTGGLGVDDWAMGEFASQINSCEIDPEIHLLAKFNLDLLGRRNVQRHLADGLDFVHQSEKTDIIYADPDRRSGASRVFRLEDCVPNILAAMPGLLEKADVVWLKVSPMADISYLKEVLPSLREIWVIAWLGEVKEILLQCSPVLGDTSLAKHLPVNAVNIGPGRTDIFQGSERGLGAHFDTVGRYLCEPNNAIIKAGLSQEYSRALNASMPAANSHLFLSGEKIPGFQGRSFEIKEQFLYKPRQVLACLKEKSISRAGITTRNFRESPDQLRKRFNLKDGGEYTLFFTTDRHKKAWVYVCQALISTGS